MLPFPNAGVGYSQCSIFRMIHTLLSQYILNIVGKTLRVNTVLRSASLLEDCMVIFCFNVFIDCRNRKPVSKTEPEECTGCEVEGKQIPT